MITTVFVMVISAIVIVYDVYVYASGQKTVSQVMAGFAKRHPVIILLWGVIMGHWFWPMCV